MTPAIVQALKKIPALHNAIAKERQPSPEGQHEQPTGKRNNEKAGGKVASEDTKNTHEKDVPIFCNTAAAEESLVELENRQKTSGIAEAWLKNPTVGHPISHSQVIELSRRRELEGLRPWRLEELLKGSRVCVPPPKPNPETVSNFLLSSWRF